MPGGHPAVSLRPGHPSACFTGVSCVLSNANGCAVGAACVYGWRVCMRGRPLAIVGGLIASLALSAPAMAQFSPGARSGGDRLLPLIGNGGYDTQHYDVTLNYDPVANAMLPGS